LIACFAASFVQAWYAAYCELALHPHVPLPLSAA
jgi:hypothetical protein